MIDHYILDENHEPVPIEVWRERTADDPWEPGALSDRIIDTEKMMEWGRFMEKREHRIVKQEHIGPYFVSTVFLALDHQWDPDRAPLLFETMVFDEEHIVEHSIFPGHRFHQEAESEECDMGQTRYSTWAQAEAGHAAMVARVQAHLTQTSAEIESHVTEEAEHGD